MLPCVPQTVISFQVAESPYWETCLFEVRVFAERLAETENGTKTAAAVDLAQNV
ncbi:Uncharacterised protein [Neisseria animalis]|nr:Uncharacterised protein [Neisseria animalis]